MEARGIAKHPAMHTRAPDKEFSSPSVSSIKVKTMQLYRNVFYPKYMLKDTPAGNNWSVKSATERNQIKEKLFHEI